MDIDDRSPEIGVVLGSGLGAFADRLENARSTPFAAIPGMPSASVVGHAGEFLIGSLGERRVAVLRGRVHTYEGHSAATVAYPIRVLAALGCTTLVVTNAAGGINPSFKVGDLMAIVDHLNLPGLSGNNPLVGAPGHRFVDMVNAYDPALVELAEGVARELGFELRRGVYAMVSGPSFETRAELRFLRAVGVDAVGMSTAPEVIVARQLGMRVLGISCITNQANPDVPTPVNHEDVLATGQAVRERFGNLLAKVIPRL
ncbi:MAG: purine-nucleoside phosphorylase [Chloroflexota bacterium]|nr:MAG: purine-nucleoside phosphorylase [Chloroflexota bacterium]